MKLARSTIKLLLVTVVNSVGGMFVFAYLAREIGSVELGIFFLFQAVSGLLLLPSDFGLRVSVEKKISEGSNRDEIFTTGLLLQIIFLLFVILFITAAEGYINSYIGRDVHAILIVFLVFKQFSTLLEAAVKGELKVNKVANVRLLRRIFWIVLSVSVAYTGHGVFELILTLIVCEVIALVGYVNYLDSTIAKPNMSDLRSTLSFAKYSVIPSVSGYAFSWIDILVIGYFLTASFVSAYELAWQIAGVIALLGNAIMTSIFPQISAWNEEGKTEQITQTVTISIMTILYISIPAFFGTFYLSEDILGLIYGPEYNTASVALVLLVIAMTFQSTRNILTKVLQGMNEEEIVNRASLVELGLNITLNVLLIPVFGLTGAAIATMISLFIGTLLRGIYIHKILEIRAPLREIAWAITSSIGMLLLIGQLSKLVSVDELNSLFLFVLFGILAYSVILLSNDSVRAQAQELFKEIVDNY